MKTRRSTDYPYLTGAIRAGALQAPRTVGPVSRQGVGAGRKIWVPGGSAEQGAAPDIQVSQRRGDVMQEGKHTFSNRSVLCVRCVVYIEICEMVSNRIFNANGIDADAILWT